MKKKVLASSVLTIALCLSLIAGSTFALFTSSSETNVAVTSGKVNVVATIKNVNLGSELGNNVPETTYNMSEGENEIAITGMIPGDYITFELHVQNNSTVTVNYRTVLKVMENSGLWEGLTVTVNGDNYEGDTRVSNWETLGAGDEPAVVYVKVLLPQTAADEYQEKTCSFAYTVEAVQGNATVTDPDANTTYIYTVNDLIAFASNVKANNTYYGKTVLLMNDIDLEGSSFNGIGADNYGDFPSGFFNGTFDGQGYTISNMTVSNLVGNLSVAGFFNGLGNNAIVQNINFENASVESNHEAGVVAGYCCTAAGNGVEQNPEAVIDNCHVNNSTVISTAHNQTDSGEYDDGDKVGGIIGYTKFEVKNCSVNNTTIIGVRDMGGIAGISYAAVSGCSVDNVNIIRDTGKIDNNSNIDDIVGRKESGCVISDCSGEVVKSTVAYVNTAEQLTTALHKGGYIVLANDIDMNGEEYYPEVNEAQNYPGVVIDGNNKTIVGLANSLINCEPNTTVNIKNLTIKNANISENYDDAQGMGTAAFVGYMDTNCVLTMTNCHLTDSTVTGTADYPGVAGLVGYKSGNGSLNIENCSVKNSVITGISNAAGVVGYITSSASISDCTVNGNTITGERADKQGTIIGTVNGGAVGVSNCNIDGVMCGRVLSGSLTCNGYQWVAEGVTKSGDTYLISNADGMFWLSAQADELKCYANVKLTADIDLANRAWTPIGWSTTQYNGTFDGNGHTIKNLNVSGDVAGDGGYGLFGWSNGTIKNLTIENATVVGDHYVGAIVGYMQAGTIESCVVKTSTVTAACKATSDNNSPCGDKAGALVGYMNNNSCKVINSSASNCTVTAARDAAKLIGYSYSGNTHTGLSATGVTVSANTANSVTNGVCTHSRAGQVSANALVGNGTSQGLN